MARIGEGEACQKTYESFTEWSEDISKTVKFKIKHGNNDVAPLKATIEKDSANIATQTSTIEDLASSIATDEADLKVATEIRDIAGKITSIDTASEVDIYHVTNYSDADFLAAIENAVTNKNYRENIGHFLFAVTDKNRFPRGHVWLCRLV